MENRYINSRLDAIDRILPTVDMNRDKRFYSSLELEKHYLKEHLEYNKYLNMNIY